jgi:hypothetical protein
MNPDPATPSRTSDLALGLVALAPAAVLADTLWRGLALGFAAVLALALGRLACLVAGRDGSPRAAAALLGAAAAAVGVGQLAHAFAFGAWTSAAAALPVAVAAAAWLRPGAGTAAIAAGPALAAAGTLVATGALRELAGAGTLGGARVAPPGFALAAAPAAGLILLGGALAVFGAAGRSR